MKRTVTVFIVKVEETSYAAKNLWAFSRKVIAFINEDRKFKRPGK